MLQHEKLVTCDDSLGFIVKRFSAKDVEEYFALRKAIEDFVIPLVVEKITKEEIAGLKANIAEGKRLIGKGGDIRSIIRCESEFHELLYRAAKSDILYDTVSGLLTISMVQSVALSVPEGRSTRHIMKR
jgi:DNA-binding GntR family transcriptional regulator